MKRAWLIGALAMFGSTVVATAQAQEMAQSQAPKDAHAYIISPQDGEVVNSSFKVKFGLSGMGVAPAGVDVKNTGHHHLLVDMDSLPPMDQPMGGDIIHFGGGQTETTLTLEPGEHTLQIILGDKNHVPHNPAVVSKKITITVKAD
ncbi:MULTISPECIES: DUF4399 domain-containing protein [Idiomarina]|jgi:hypothetical protein|uniref:DUF4399 domain-containing protein n=2 Tax=Idiomarina baltica TaxID=190892 RepID=A0A348WNP2_9GAMM|nr:MULTISPECIES: DUF4399 domain-containing protein [Idiomarina]EAQ33227.1 Uncharacterized conserved secreted protein [Idiomarina baltica OS145]KXS34413.1 MAG: hypothetical protein AWU56_2050 [Idiomarina sp. T82-3]HAE89606.1 DUF4399 domain-containing protein [Idiomarina sp.]HAR56154.1 DUF4399 domain-containing protein [Idiomarina baltica]|tara:strand:+ start:3430 stop:3867 length:438 start_codon:yes stop_codon:yes gene_type:complete